MKKILSYLLIIVMVFALVGCQKVKELLSDEENVQEVEVIEEDLTEKNTESKAEEKTEEIEIEETEEIEIEETETPETISEEINEEDEAEEDSKPVTAADLGNKYVDLDNRSFAYNGKVYTLGVSTLQDMIDDGVPFRERDIANANNNLNPNTESQNFSIELDEFYAAQVSTGNFTDEHMTMAEAPITSIYLPVHLEYNNDNLTFAFPLTLTEEELIANAGEPTEIDEYIGDGDHEYHMRKLMYMVDSEKYFGQSGYRFEFLNGELDYVTINLK